MGTGGTLIGDAASNSSGNDSEAWLLGQRTNLTTSGEVSTSVSQVFTRTVASGAGNAALFEIRAA